MQELDPRDRDLLTAMQAEVPLYSTPYALIGQQIDMSEKEVIKRAERLKRDGVLKHIGMFEDERDTAIAWVSTPATTGDGGGCTMHGEGRASSGFSLALAVALARMANSWRRSAGRQFGKRARIPDDRDP